MTVDKRIVDALSPLQMDIENEIYQGKNKKYIVFNYSTVGDAFADDEAQAERYLCQVHLFAPLSEDITALKKQIKTALRNAGFTHPETLSATDENGRHIVFEFQWAEGWSEE